MTVHTDELLERKWRELGNVPIDYTLTSRTAFWGRIGSSSSRANR